MDAIPDNEKLFSAVTDLRAIANVTRIKLLMIIEAENGFRGVTRLGERVDATPAHTSALLKRSIELGLIEKNLDSRYLTITDKGRWWLDIVRAHSRLN